MPHSLAALVKGAHNFAGSPFVVKRPRCIVFCHVDVVFEGVTDPEHDGDVTASLSKRVSFMIAFAVFAIAPSSDWTYVEGARYLLELFSELGNLTGSWASEFNPSTFTSIVTLVSIV